MTTYYVSNDGDDDSNTGLSDAQAWQTIDKVNSTSFNVGDDVYFKCDDTWTDSNQLFVDWAGVDGNNYATIGAYYMDGGVETIGVSGTRPIIDGETTKPAVETDGLIEVNGDDYIKFENLKVVNSNGYAMFLYQSDNSIVDNCEVDWSFRQGIFFVGSDDGTAQYNNVTRTGQRHSPGNSLWGPAISFKNSNNGTAKYNTVHECWGEGIAFGSDVAGKAGLTAEYNLVYDTGGPGIYFWNVGDTSNHNICRYNLVYRSNNSTYYEDQDGSDYYAYAGIYIVDEASWGFAEDGYIDVYGNLIAGYWTAGIWLGFSAASGGTMTDSVIYNNTIVDTKYIFKIIANRFSNTNIKNNIGWGIQSGYEMINGADPTNATWDYNLWSHEPEEAGGKGANDPTYAVPNISKTTGWNTISPGDLDGSEFEIQTGSSCIDAGANLGVSYDDALEPGNVDFTASPIDVNIVDQDDY